MQEVITMLRIRSTALALAFTLTVTFAAPATTAQAFSLNDLVNQSVTPSASVTGGNGIMDLLLGLLLGKLVGNMNSAAATAPSPVDTLTKVLGLTNIPTTSDSSADTKGTALITSASKYMGVPYVWGGSTPAGFDCSGFTQYVMQQNGITIPRTAEEQYATGKPVDKSQLKVGDLVFFTTYKAGASHVGFYMGNSKFIHASSAQKQVAISSLDEAYYVEKYIGARRYF